MAAATVLEGDATFERVVLPHRPLLLRVARRLTGSAVEAEDLVQETLLRALRAYEGLRPGSQVKAWLLCILRNTWISAWRRRQSERTLLQQGAWAVRAPWLQGSEPGPHDGVGVPVLSAEVVQALGRLPLQYRSCVELVDLEQRTYREAARMIGRPVGTVMSRLSRGRRLLRGMLEGYARTEGYLASAA